MYKFVILPLVILFAISAWADGPTLVRCESANLGGYSVTIRGEGNDLEAILTREGLEKGRVFEEYSVIRVEPTMPGAPLKFVSPDGESFVLSICESCTPIDGKSSATLSAEIPKSSVIEDLPMLCETRPSAPDPEP